MTEILGKIGSPNVPYVFFNAMVTSVRLTSFFRWLNSKALLYLITLPHVHLIWYLFLEKTNSYGPFVPNDIQKSLIFLFFKSILSIVFRPNFRNLVLKRIEVFSDDWYAWKDGLFIKFARFRALNVISCPIYSVTSLKKVTRSSSAKLYENIIRDSFVGHSKKIKSRADIFCVSDPRSWNGQSLNNGQSHNFNCQFHGPWLDNIKCLMHLI